MTPDENETLASPRFSGTSRRFYGLEVIGRGGNGVVYRAYDQQTEEMVALKVLSRDSGKRGVVEKFKREALLTRDLVHEGILQVYEYLPETNGGILVLELVEGGSLEQFISLQISTMLSRDARITALLDIARALRHVHKRGIIHRDVKPHNILLTSAGYAKLADFGVACFAADVWKLSNEELTSGTAAYMAPEQFRSGQVSYGLDVYAFGITAAELSLGRRLFGGEAYVTIALQHLSTDIDLRKEGVDLPDWCLSIIEQCVSKDPGRRFPSMIEVCDELERHAPRTARDELAAAVSSLDSYRANRRMARRRQKLLRGCSVIFTIYIIVITLATAGSQVHGVWATAIWAQAFALRLAGYGWIGKPLEWATNTQALDLEDPRLLLKLLQSAIENERPGLDDEPMNSLLYARELAGSYSNLLGARDTEGRTPLILALQTGRFTLANKLLSTLPNLSIAANNGRTAAFEIVAKGRADWLHKYFQQVDLRHVDSSGNTIIHEAVRAQQIECLRYLLSVDDVTQHLIDVQNFSGETPLKLSLQSELAEQMATMLISAGANLTLTSADGNAPLRVAILNNQIKVATAIATHLTEQQILSAGSEGDPILAPLLLKTVLADEDYQLLRVLLIRAPTLHHLRIGQLLPEQLALREGHVEAANLLRGGDSPTS